MLSNDDIRAILSETLISCNNQDDPAITSFFDFLEEDAEVPNRAVSFHKWSLGDLTVCQVDTDVAELSHLLVVDFLSVPLKVAREMIIGNEELLPSQPLYLDASPTFSSKSILTGENRFSLIGGNTMKSTGELSKDIRLAAGRLNSINYNSPVNNKHNWFKILCPETLFESLLSAGTRTGLNIEIIGHPWLEKDDPWIVCRSDAQPVALKVVKPSINIELGKGSLSIGAQIVVWVKDPAASVRVSQIPGE